MMFLVWKTTLISIIFASIVKNHILLLSINFKVSVPYKLEVVYFFFIIFFFITLCSNPTHTISTNITITKITVAT